MVQPGGHHAGGSHSGSTQGSHWSVQASLHSAPFAQVSGHNSALHVSVHVSGHGSMHASGHGSHLLSQGGEQCWSRQQ